MQIYEQIVNANGNNKMKKQVRKYYKFNNFKQLFLLFLCY